MSALSGKVAPGKMGAALDTWAQHYALNTAAALFHGGTVDILQEPPMRHTWKASCACAVYPIGIDQTDLAIGSRGRFIAIVTGHYFKDRVGTRSLAEPGIEDLEEVWDAAVWDNLSLRWGTTGEGWPEVPSPSVAVANIALARKLVAQLPTHYSDFLDEKGKRCGERLAEFVSIYEIKFDNC